MMNRTRMTCRAAVFVMFVAMLAPGSVISAMVCTQDSGAKRGQPVLPPPSETTNNQADDGPATPALPQSTNITTLDNGVTVIKQQIPGTDHATAIVMLHVGSMHDPVQAPGLSRLLDHLLISAPSEDVGVRNVEDLDKQYRAGWNIRSQPWSSVYGVIVKRDALAGEIEQISQRLRTLAIGPESVAGAIKGVERDMAIMFDQRPILKPMSWLVVKAFRHDSGAPRGVDTIRLARLRPDWLHDQWRQRIVGGNITLVLTGAVDGLDVDTAVNSAFGKFDTGTQPQWDVTVHPVGSVVRDVLASHGLPSNKHHGVAAFFAPKITHPDHPAFFVISHSLMLSAANLAGAEARLDFQYDILLDPRAAYETPQIWRFPKGFKQALGYWDAKIKNTKFNRGDSRKLLTMVGWQLGGDLSGDLVNELGRTPALLYSVGYATGMRRFFGDDAFWAKYRDSVKRLSERDLDAARDLYFSDANRAIFILKGDEPN